jgi:amyloid beta precursor protein binding protein 1
MPLFESLQAVYDTVSKLDTIVDTKDRSHVPYVILLLQALDTWRNSRGGSTTATSSSHSSSSSGGNGGKWETTADGAREYHHDAVPPSPGGESKQPSPPLQSSIPKTMAEKDDFRLIVKQMTNNINNEINFDEAIREAHLVWSDDQLSEDVQLVLDKVDEMSFIRNVIIKSLDDDNTMDVEGAASGSSSSGVAIPSHVLQFQLLLVALKRYLLVNNNYPPLEGTIPDMTSDTLRFVALQEAYRSQAEKDRIQLCTIITSLLNECTEHAAGGALRIAMPSDEVIQTFCKNVRYLRILETRPLYVEYMVQDTTSPIVQMFNNTIKLSSNIINNNNFTTLTSDARDDLLSSTMDPYETDPAQTPLLWWIALRACDAFYDRHQHYPGKHDQELALEADANEVYNCMLEIVHSLGLVDDENTSELIKVYILDKVKGKDLAREVVRYDEAEIHTIAAVVGGVASQEAVKLITGQYVPIDDTYVYNGIASTAGVYRF